MADNLDLKKLEKKAYLEYQQDGILDIIIGLSILGFGIQMATDSAAFLFLSWVPILFYVPLKNRITVPRFGYVQFDSDRSKTLKYSLAMVVGLVFLVFFMGIYIFTVGNNIPPTVNAFIKKYHMLILGGFAALTFMGVAIFTGVLRFMGYALLMPAVIAIGIWLDVPAPIYILIVGGLILLSGILLLFQFLKSHPIVSQD